MTFFGYVLCVGYNKNPKWNSLSCLRLAPSRRACYPIYEALHSFPSNGLVVESHTLISIVKVLDKKLVNLFEVSNILGKINLLASLFVLV